MNTSYIVRMRLILFAAFAVTGVFILATAARAQTPIFTPVHSFSGKPDGQQPFAGRLVQGLYGEFYGTTFNGGTNNAGCIYDFPPNGGVSVLYSFSGGADGGYPEAGLALGSNGYFYGVTTYGGVTTDGSVFGNGVVFKMDQFGSLSLLYTFTNGTDGYGPQAALVQGTNGNFYGTTANGGATTNGYGTIFMITPGGSVFLTLRVPGGRRRQHAERAAD